MQLTLDQSGQKTMNADVKIVSAFQKTKTSKVKGKATTEVVVSIDHWSDKSLKEEFSQLRAIKHFKAPKMK